MDGILKNMENMGIDFLYCLMRTATWCPTYRYRYRYMFYRQTNNFLSLLY